MLKLTLFYIGIGIIPVFSIAFIMYRLIILKEDIEEKEEQYDDYEVPKLKELTEEQIENIHVRGKITPAEKLKEWEELDLCAPGDAIGSAAWRCHKFRNCHDCLVDYANTQDEYTSFYDDIKIICK